MHVYGETMQNANLMRKVSQAHYTYLMSGFKPFNLNHAERVENLVKMPQRFSDMFEKHPKNALLQELYLKPGVEGRFYIAMPNLKKTVSFKEGLVDAWRDLLSSDKGFAEDLIRYSFLTSGFNRSLSQFYEYIPFEWLNEQRIKDRFKGKNAGEVIDLTSNYLSAKKFDEVKWAFDAVEETTAPQGMGFSINTNMHGDPYITSLKRVIFKNNFPAPLTQDNSPGSVIKFYVKKVTHTITKDAGYKCALEISDTYDIVGRKVSIAVNDFYNAGTYVLEWQALDESGNALPSGIYFARVQAGKYVKTIKMIYNR